MKFIFPQQKEEDLWYDGPYKHGAAWGVQTGLPVTEEWLKFKGLTFKSELEKSAEHLTNKRMYWNHRKKQKERAKKNSKMEVYKENCETVRDNAAWHSNSILATRKKLNHIIEKGCHIPAPFTSDNNITDNGTLSAIREPLHRKDTGKTRGARAGSSSDQGKAHPWRKGEVGHPPPSGCC